MQFAQGFSALQTGLLLLALAAGSFLASGASVAVASKVSGVKLVRTGLSLEIAGVTAIGLVIAIGLGWGWLAPALAVYGFGVGLATAQLTGIVLTDVPAQQSGQASGAQSTARQVGSALGIAILGTILFSATGLALTDSLSHSSLPEDQRESVVSVIVDTGGAAIQSLESESPHTAQLAKDALSAGTAAATFTAAGFLTLGLISSAALRSPKMKSSEPGRNSSGTL